MLSPMSSKGLQAGENCFLIIQPQSFSADLKSTTCLAFDLPRSKYFLEIGAKFLARLAELSFFAKIDPK